MHISAIYFLDSLNKVIIFRHYRGDDLQQGLEQFQSYFLKQEGAIKPVIEINGTSYIHIKHNDICILAISSLNANVAVILQFLYNLLNILKGYFKEVEEESLRDNFVITYELLDEIMDFGYPQLTEPSLLKHYIVQNSHQLSRSRVTNISNEMSLRSENLSYSKNSVYIDVVETVNMLVSNSGVVMNSEICGNIHAISFLVGNPELKICFNDKLKFDIYSDNSVENDKLQLAKNSNEMDYKLSQFAKVCKDISNCIFCIPPNDGFELMTYRISSSFSPLLWVEAVTEFHSHFRVKYLIKAYTNLKIVSGISKVSIEVPVPSDVDTPKFKYQFGSVQYLPAKNVIVWDIKRVFKDTDYLMSAQFGLSSIDSEDKNNRRPINVKFELSSHTASGLQIKYLDSTDKKKRNVNSWVRYATVNGSYQFRF